MIFIRTHKEKLQRYADLEDLFAGQTAFLMGGAPSIKEQPLELLQKRGVLTAAMNNAAIHFQPDIWISSDRPECYEPQILLDPKIMKFAPIAHADARLDGPYKGRRYGNMPNMFFYKQAADVPWEQFLDKHTGVPWYNNTLMSAIHILYRLGIKTIILGGSDFGFKADGPQYAHDAKLGDLQQKWNTDLYDSLVEELRILSKYFETMGITFMDCSVNSRLAQTYQKLSMEEAVVKCLTTFPESMVDPSTLPHCSKFAPKNIKELVAQWPGYQAPAPQNDRDTVVGKKPKRELKTVI